MIESSPSVDPASIETFWKIVTLFPMTTLSPIVVNGPTATFVPSLALDAMEVFGDTPFGMGRTENQRVMMRAIAK